MRFGSVPVAVTMVLVLALCAGCGSSGSSKGSGDPSKVSATKYVSSVCSAISPLEKDVVNRSSALNNSTAANATQAKKTLKGFLTAVEQDSDNALSRIQTAGTPDISNGKVVAGTIVKAFTELRDAMRVAVTKSDTLPTGSPTSFKTAAQALGANVRGALGKIDSSGLSNSDLEQAAAKVPACKSLSG